MAVWRQVADFTRLAPGRTRRRAVVALQHPAALCCTAPIPAIPPDHRGVLHMYQQINEQFTAASRQFADTAARINRLAIDNATQVFGLQLAAFEAGANATLAFLGEVAEVRSPEAFKTVATKGLQVARENVERG